MKYCTMRPLLGRYCSEPCNNPNRNHQTVHGIQPGNAQASMNPFNMNALQGCLPTEVDVRCPDSLGLATFYSAHRFISDTPVSEANMNGHINAVDLYLQTQADAKSLDKDTKEDNQLAAGIQAILSQSFGGKEEDVYLNNTAIHPPLVDGRQLGRAFLPTSTQLSVDHLPHSNLALSPSPAFVGERFVPCYAQPRAWESCGTIPKPQLSKIRKSRPNKTANDNTRWLRCEICDCNVNSEYQVKIHIEGLKHRKKLSQLQRQMSSGGLPYCQMTEPTSQTSPPVLSYPPVRCIQSMAAQRSFPRWSTSAQDTLHSESGRPWPQPSSEVQGQWNYESDSAYSGSDNDSTVSV